MVSRWLLFSSNRFILFFGMKLSPRNYNIIFHLHTVSGIVLSAALFIIFFAGAFTLFKGEFYLWENPTARRIYVSEPQLDEVIQGISKLKPDFDWNDDTYLTFAQKDYPLMQVYGHLHVPEGELHYEGKWLPNTGELLENPPSTTGQTLYKLHYFAQIPYVGMWLAGFVSLFFIFAIITGVIIHWNNIWTKFWSFSLKGAWKQIWTNSHTVFGLLGLPYQFMYAVTGAFYLLLLLALLPAVMFFYEGKPEKVYALAYPMYGVEYNEEALTLRTPLSVQSAYERVVQDYGKDYKILAVQTHHLLKEDGVANFRLVSKDPHRFISNGYVGYRLKDLEVIYSAMPSTKFSYAFVEGIMQLHFASFGGWMIKGIYFLLALFSCFVFVSGILIWKEARKYSRYTLKQQNFHARTTQIFLSICFSLFPAVALLFSMDLIVPSGENHAKNVNLVFFLFWLVWSVISYFSGNEAKSFRLNLFAGGVLGLCVPLSNGFTTGDWVWNSPLPMVLATDIAWLTFSIISGVMAFTVGHGKPTSIPPYRQSAT